MMKTWLQKNWRWLPLVVVVLATGFDIAHLLLLNDGHFIYPLDDTYISMRMAENSAHGDYGINPGEPASASSSPLWGFMLVPFAWAGKATLEAAPFVLNLIFCFLTAWILPKIITFIFKDDMKDQWPLWALLATLLTLALNLPATILAGMEHGMQIYVTLVAAFGLLRFCENGTKPSAWMWLALILGPLLRYENLTFSGMALLLLMWWGMVRPAFFSGVIIVLLLGGFGYFLMHQGLLPMPNSVLSKIYIQNPYWFEMLDKMTYVQQWILIAAFIGTVMGYQRNKEPRKRQLASFMGIALLAHILFGRVSHGTRYELYVLAYMVPVLLYLHRPGLLSLFSGKPMWQSLLRVAVGTICIFSVYVAYSVWNVSRASNEIYMQQVQFTRFIRDFYPTDVAVNDIGYISLNGGGHYVLDMAGISSERGRKAVWKLKDEGPNRLWMTELLKEKNITIAIVYEDWYHKYIPPSWVRVGYLEVEKETIIAKKVVSFYATTVAEAEKMHKALEAFAPTLPNGVQFHFLEEGQT